MSKWIPVSEKDRLGVVTYNFGHEGIYSLKLEIGDTVQNLSEEENWYFGYSFRNPSIKGIYPKNYIRIVESYLEKTACGEQVLLKQPLMVAEITSALRDWLKITHAFYTSHKEKWKGIFKLMGDLMNKRSKIISGTLTIEELRDLRQTITAQIDFGNFLLRLDMVVRDVEGNILNPEKTSVVHMYRCHESASQRVKKSVTIGTSRWTEAYMSSPKKEKKSANRHSHMFFVAVRNFVSRIGEDTELLLCLFDTKEWKPLTENYVIRWSRQGLTLDLDLLGNLKALFADLGSKDLVRERIFLVCYVVRVGQMEIRDDCRRGAASTRRVLSGQPGVASVEDYSIRRPCGIAAMDVSDLVSGKLETDEEKQHFIPFIACGDRESMDATLRRIVISTREITQKDHKNCGLWISMRLLHGDFRQEKHPALVVGNVAVSRKLGFPEIILPGDVRHDLYLTLISGEFWRGVKSADKNVEVTVRVCNERGQSIPGVIALGSGIETQDEYRSVVYYHEDKPKWMETLKIAIPIDEFYRSHLKFTFKHRSSNETKDRQEKPFALSYVRLMQGNGTTLLDTQHELLIYKLSSTRKYEENETVYLKLPSTRAELSGSDDDPSIPGFSLKVKDSFLISSCLCSTKLTQNVDLLGLLKTQSESDQLPTILTTFMNVEAEEIIKFLQDVLDALFNIMMLNSESDTYDRLVFDCLIFIISLVTDRKFEHFKPVLDLYIRENFSATLAYKKLLGVLQVFIEAEVATKMQGDDLLRVMKSLHYIFKFIVRSRQLYTALDDSACPDDFDSKLQGVLFSMANLMKRNEDFVLLAQGACLKYIPCAIPELITVFNIQDLSNALSEIITSLPAGRLNNQKMMTLNDIVHSKLFTFPECRAILLPVVVRRVKELLTGPQENGFNSYKVELRKERSKCKAAWLLGQQQVEQPKSRLSNENTLNQEVEMSVTVMCDVMEILYQRDVGSTYNDVVEVMTNGLRTIIQTVINMNRDDAFLGHLVSVMLAMFRQMTPHHYRNYLASFATRTDLLDFLIEILMVFKDLVAQRVFNEDWVQMILLQNSIILKGLRLFSHTIRDSFSNPFEGQLWNNYFNCAITYVTQSDLQLEDFIPSKRRQITASYSDMRREMGLEIRTMWFNLGQHKINFVPSMVGQFLEMSLLPETEIRKATIPIFFDMMQCEYYSPRHQGEAYSETKRDPSHIKGNFQDVENNIITQLDVLVEGGRGDEHYKDLFSEIMTELCENHSTLREQGLRFVRTVRSLMERLLEYRSIITDENRENRMSCTVNLLNFYKGIGRQEMYIRYLNKLCDLHLECDNFTEAAFTLQLHADLLSWSNEPLPTLLLTSKHPQATTHRELKEALYCDSIDYFDRGKMYECALGLCKELVQQYEIATYEYGPLSALLLRMSKFYENIMKVLRLEPEYFRVAFYGRGFPAFLQNKSFVFRGHECERLATFQDRILMQFPNASIMNTLAPPDQEIMDSPLQYLQIVKVDPIMEDQERFGSKLVSDQILGFYRVNLVQQFSFNRTFHHGVRDPDNLFSSLWMERTILTTSHVLPGILRWFPVVNSRVIQISPLQNAIETMESTNRILKKNILAHCYDPHLCLHPLTIKLKGVLDAAVNGGISNYEKAFFTDKYKAEHLDEEDQILELRELIAQQIPLLEAGLVVHRSRVNEAVQPLQELLDECFVQMRNHVESKYGHREIDPEFAREMTGFFSDQRRSTSLTISMNQLSIGSCGDDTTSSMNTLTNRRGNSSSVLMSQRNSTVSSISSLSNTMSQRVTSYARNTSSNSLFSRGSTQTQNSSLPSTPAAPSLSPVKMLAAKSFRDRNAKKDLSEKKIRDKENKRQRDSFRRLSSSSIGKSTPFSGLSLAGFGLGQSSMTLSNPTSLPSANSLRSSANSLDISSSQTMEINTTTTGVIELNQQLTSKRPLRPEATRERRSSAASRSISIDGSGVCSSPSQNSIASTLSTSSDDVPPPLPVKQNVIDGYNPTPPEKPALPTNPIDINEDTSSLPPPPPPKKPVRIIPK